MLQLRLCVWHTRFASVIGPLETKIKTNLKGTLMKNENELAGLQGSCLCGSVTFELFGKINNFYLCHCLRCRRSTGTAHVSTIVTDPENIRWLTGEEWIKRFDLPEAETFSKQFCTECGSPVPCVDRDGNQLRIPAGTLEQSTNVQPQRNIYWESKAKWYEQGLDAPRYEEYDKKRIS